VAYKFDAVEVVRSYDNRMHGYRWEADDLAVGQEGFKEILDARALAGWELVSACVDSYRENNTMMEATSYRLFFRRDRVTSKDSQESRSGGRFVSVAAGAGRRGRGSGRTPQGRIHRALQGETCYGHRGCLCFRRTTRIWPPIWQRSRSTSCSRRC
jgi:hypothetical protein